MDLDEFLSASELSLALTQEEKSLVDFSRGRVNEAKDNEFEELDKVSELLDNNSQLGENGLDSHASTCGTTYLSTLHNSPAGQEQVPGVLSIIADCNTCNSTDAKLDSNEMQKGKKSDAPKVHAFTLTLSSPGNKLMQGQPPVSPLSTCNSLETDEGKGDSIDSDEGQLLQSSTHGSNYDKDPQERNLHKNSSFNENSLNLQGKGKTRAAKSRRSNTKPVKTGQGTLTKKQKSFLQTDLLDYNPTPVTRKGKRKKIPEECKDAKYWERRERNNVAAKRSRDMRREKECCIKERVTELEQENSKLRETVQELTKKLAFSEQKLKEKERKASR